jgi:hypothetical protein
MPLEILIVVLIVAVLVVAVPVRRLVLDGYSGWAVVAYCALIGFLAVGVTEARTLGRVLLPLLGLAYIAPFITLGGGLDRLLGRRRPVVRVTPVATRAIEPPRDVTPRDATPRDAGPGDEPHADVPPPDPSDRPGPSA